ncbi:type II secretion system F family protein [Bogoriella caseilytica]|uniref:Tight adherence protein C n=1 Tax=Bogoriella caseilytica TaxID=56055 RepID=A0A3N2BDC8_9MICO|nr:type II secretion system F family protein [Bogoriella caseilytica]ROR73248.1 tight adherence protein C [Bogoriella caseilytica]
MPPLIMIAVAFVAMALCALTWAVLAGPDRGRERTLDNLHRGLHQRPEQSASSAEGSGSGVLAAITRRLTPSASLRQLERLLMRAGRPPAWPVERLAAAKLLGAGVSATLSLLFISSEPRPLTVLVGGGATVVCYFLPELLLHSRGQERSQEIALGLADTLDQMTIAVEAGLGFDSAMARAGKNGTGPLAEELIRTLQDIQLGQSRREAYESLALRTEVPDLRRFVRSLIQADAYGIAVADVLRTQAAEMRVKRRQRAEEKAMQIPVKVIFPLMMCILPVLFIVLLGPAVMDIIDAFG